jgi:hypothetical protein
MQRLLGAFISCYRTATSNSGIPMTATEPAELTTDQVVEAVYRFAAEQMRDGVPPARVERSLVEKGLSPEAAAIVVRNLGQAMAKARQDAAQQNILHGALWCIAGIVVTAATYTAAASGGGGTYVVAWGAIIFGAIQFFRGLSQSAEPESA